MEEITLKYGLNPHQRASRVYINDGDLPFKVLNGRPGYINLLDALSGWQLVRKLQSTLGICAAASFKHVSPAGAAIGLPLNDTLRASYFIPRDEELSPIAAAYARARGADRMSSYGDFIALSDTCDTSTARLIAREVSDGIIAPDYEGAALEILKDKKKGKYCILKASRDYTPPISEIRQVFGVTFEETRNDPVIDYSVLSNIVTDRKTFSDEEKRDLVLAMIVLLYTQSNSVCYAKDGAAIGIGAGQQSRIHCTRLAGNKADNWYLRLSPVVQGLPFRDDIRRADRDNAIDSYINGYYDEILGDGIWQGIFKTRPDIWLLADKKEWLKTLNGVSLASDAFFPFGDNIRRAARSGVSAIAQPGGSIRDDNVILECNKVNIAMTFTGIRLFTH